MKDMKKLIVIGLLALVGQTANAQFGNILNRVKSSAQSSLENAVVNGVNDAGRSAVKATKNKMKKAKKGKAEEATWTYGEHTYTMKGNLTADRHLQYQVFNCPSLYTGCRQIQGTWGGLE